MGNRRSAATAGCFSAVGQQVEIKVSTFGDRRFTGRVVYIGETLNPETRTAQVRCLVHNARGDLKPEMYATISIASEKGRMSWPLRAKR